MSQILKYDLRAAYESGEKEYPNIVMKKLGYKLLSQEGCSMADAVFFEVEENDITLKPFLEKSDYKIE